MPEPVPADDDLLRRLPLPLAQLHRRALNAKTPLDLHQAAYYLWEAALKLLGSAAVVAYAEHANPDPELADRLKNLARPALGHWWEFVRRLLPILADGGDPGFAAARDLVLGRRRDDLPRAAGLDALLEGLATGREGARAAVRLSELFDRLVQYRNRVPGHGAVGMHPPSHYQRYGLALRAGAAEVLARLDVLAGRCLVYVPDVRRQPSGRWLVERYELRGEVARRLESLDLPESGAAAGLLPDRLYLEAAGSGAALGLRPLHPLAVYDAEGGRLLFLNARRGGQRAEYLCYTTGAVSERDDAGGERRALLARVLGVLVDAALEEQWATRSQAEEPTAPREPEPTARRLGEFELLSELGRGGMGVVYRAWQPSLGRQVAVKKLFQVGDPKAEAQFAREVRALGRVEHPHLVRVFTSGSEGENWFFAMELLEGATLEGVCAQLQARSPRPEAVDAPTWTSAVTTACAEARRSEVPLSDPANDPSSPARSAGTAPPESAERPPVRGGPGHVRRVAELVRQVAEAAHALHEAGILHRDIKPGNVMVDEAGERAVLMDLGLAQVADEVDGRLTRTRQIVGTLRYASPEQVAGVGGLDRRSDVYSLGATLWELLTLRPMFGATAGTPAAELIRRIPVEEVVRPRKHHPGLPRDLEAVVLKCLEKEPQRRYGTAAELAEELRRFLAEEPVRARAVGTTRRALKWARRRPMVAGLVTSLVVATLTGVGGVLWAYGQAVRQARRADEEAGRARTAAARADEKAREAENARLRADMKSEETRRLLYAADINLAESAWRDNKPGRVLQLLHPYESEPGQEPDLRGIEWYLLHRLSQPAVQSLPRVRFATWHPTNRRLLAVLEEGSPVVKLWDYVAAREVRRFPNPSTSAWYCVFSPDARELACLGTQATVKWVVKRWNVATGEELPVFTGSNEPPNQAWGVAYSPDGRRLALQQDKCVRVWDLSTNKEQFNFAGDFQRGFSAIAFSPDGRKLANATTGGISVRTLGGNNEVQFLSGTFDALSGIAWSPNGRQLAAGDFDGTVRIWDVSSRQPSRELTKHKDIVRAVAYSPDGRFLASASDDHSVRIWDLTHGGNQLVAYGHLGRVWTVQFSPDGRRLLSSGAGSTNLWDALPSTELSPHAGGQSFSCVFSPDSRRVASSFWDPYLDTYQAVVWDVVTGQQLTTVQHPACRDVQVFPGQDDVRLAWGASGGGTVVLWDPTTGRDRSVLHGTLTGHSYGILSVDGRWLAVMFRSDDADSGRSEVCVFETATGRNVKTISCPDWRSLATAFSADARRFCFTTGNVGEVVVWDRTTDSEQRISTNHTSGVSCLALSADGKQLATGSRDKSIRTWEVSSGRLLRTFQGHTDRVFSITFSPDGHRLATSSDDRTVKIWDLFNGQVLLTLREDRRFWGIAFSPDGQWLATMVEGHALRLWDARPLNTAVREECEAAGVWRWWLNQPLLKGDILTRIHQDPTIRDSVRARALSLAEFYRDDPWRFCRTSRTMARQIGLPLETYVEALRHAELAAHLAPEDSYILTTLGIAQYRTGRYAHALQTLTRSNELNSAKPAGAHPADLAFLALTYFHLGEVDRAQSVLPRLREVMSQRRWAQHEESRGFLQEAENALKQQ